MESSLLWINKQVLFQLNTTYDAKPFVCCRINMTSWKLESSPGQNTGVKTSVDIDSTLSAIVYTLASNTNRATNLPTRAPKPRGAQHGGSKELKINKLVVSTQSRG
jgi:hypothetical protein